MAQRIEHIALFPLNVFLLPGEYLQLYIFEPRYRQLIGDCDLKEIGAFGISCLDESNELDLGATVELREVIKHYPNGEMDVLVQATSVFRLRKFHLQYEGKMYPKGEVIPLNDIRNVPVSHELETAFKAHLLKYDNLNTELMAETHLGIFDVANELGMDQSEKLELAELGTNAERDRYLINYLRYLNILEKQENSVQNDIYLN